MSPDPSLSIVAIDPGASGAIVWMFRDKGRIVVQPYPTPETETDVSQLVANIASVSGTRGIIERVNAFPGQGIVSAWKFSASYHQLRMAMICHQLPFEEVAPRVWQQALGVPVRKKEETKTAHKNKLKGMAQQLFPHIKVTLAIADALLMAEYLRRIVEGERAR